MEVVCQLCHYQEHYHQLLVWFFFFWFLIALFLYPMSTILDSLDYFSLILNMFAYQTSFWEVLSCQYLVNLISKKKLSSFNDWINTYFQSFICLSRYEHLMASIICKVSLALLNIIQLILERLNEKTTKPWKPLIIDRLKWW